MIRAITIAAVIACALFPAMHTATIMNAAAPINLYLVIYNTYHD